MMDYETRKPICRSCLERPDNCWKAVEYGCAIKRATAERNALACPINKWTLLPYFDRVVVISLGRRQDRLKQFLAGLPAEFPFRRPEVFVAVDGKDDPGYPETWGGRGSWGCRESHLRVLQSAIEDCAKRVLVFEDDCIFCDGFNRLASKFLMSVPADWDCLMLGGQHRGGKRDLIAEGVVQCQNTQRTHAYAVQGQFMVDLANRWGEMTSGHIDHVLGPFAARYHTYAVAPFICGQREGYSNISCKTQAEHFWGGVLSTKRPTSTEFREKRMGILDARNTKKQTATSARAAFLR